MTTENLGPAERIIQTLLSYPDHCVHNRPGVIEKDTSSVTGVRWTAATHKVEADGTKTVFKLSKNGKKDIRTPIGKMNGDGQIRNDAGAVVARYKEPGLFPEATAWRYKQVAEVWKLNNEFAARWASYAFDQEDSRDMKTILAAFMLCQSRKGDPVKDGGKVAFYDDDFRDVGEAMMLIQRKGNKDPIPKLLLRIHDLLSLPEVAQINRELGFGNSARKPFLGRWPELVEKWLRHREQNPKILEGLMKSGFRRTVMALAQRVGYKPESPKFYEILRWKQIQSADGRRTMAIGKAVEARESWEGFTEEQVCEKIVATKPGYKVLVALLPKSVGLTPAVMTAAVTSGCLSNKDLVILTPTLEALGLLQVPEVATRWEKATKEADDMRAANIARNVKSKEAKDKLQESADAAVQKAVAEVVRGLRIYFFVDISGSMDGAIDAARDHVAKFLQAFPLDRLHVATFNTVGHEVKIPHASEVGVRNAFSSYRASGGTCHFQGIEALKKYKPAPDEDTLFIWVGDEADSNMHSFEQYVKASGLNPMAFGLIKVIGRQGDNGDSVRRTATALQIPCFIIDNRTFADPYAIPQTIRALIASTPVGQKGTAEASKRVSLVDTIIKTKLLTKPTWAA